MTHSILPTPRQAEEYAAPGFVTDGCPICVVADEDKRVIRRAAELARDLGNADGTVHPLTHGEGAIVIVRDPSLPTEGYRLTINKGGVRLEGGDAAGAFYAIVTLQQLVAVYGRELPALTVTDWPDLPHRGYYYDVTRGRVPTVAGIKRIVDTLVAYKVNALQLYVEHTFAFREFADRTDALGAEEILEIDTYCRERFVDFIPSISTFGHLYELLTRPEYRHLCELEDYEAAHHFWLERMAHHTIDPTNPASFSLVCSLLDQYLPLFSSEYVNICCDETFDLCQGRNRGKNRGELYTAFVNALIGHVAARGKKVMMWADIALEHPEALAGIPADTVFLNWEYGPSPDPGKAARLRAAGRQQILCPGTSSWSRLMEDVNVSIPNISRMARIGRDNGAVGLLNTNWGDFGHPCAFECALYGAVFGACVAWRVDTEANEAYDRAVARLVYGVEEPMLPLLQELAAAHEATPWQALFYWNARRDVACLPGDIPALKQAIARCTDALDRLDKTELNAAVAPYLRVAVRGIRLLNEAALCIKTQGDPVPWKAKAARWLSDYEALWRTFDKESELSEIRTFVEKIF